MSYDFRRQLLGIVADLQAGIDASQDIIETLGHQGLRSECERARLVERLVTLRVKADQLKSQIEISKRSSQISDRTKNVPDM